MGWGIRGLHNRRGWRGLTKWLCHLDESHLAAPYRCTVCEEACTAYLYGDDSFSKEGKEKGTY